MAFGTFLERNSFPDVSESSMDVSAAHSLPRFRRGTTFRTTSAKAIREAILDQRGRAGCGHVCGRIQFKGPRGAQPIPTEFEWSFFSRTSPRRKVWCGSRSSSARTVDDEQESGSGV